MLSERGQGLQAIAVVVGFLAVVYGGWYAVWQSNPSEYPKPPFAESISGEDVIEIKYTRMDVTVETRGWRWDDDTVDIEDYTIETKKEEAPASILDTLLLDRTIKGEVQVVVKKDGDVRDSWRKNYEITEGTFEYTASETHTTDWLKMGRINTGQYTILAKIYNEEGEVVNTDEIQVSSTD